MAKLEYVQVAWMEMNPNIYGGENCNQHIARWYAFCEGDKDSECSTAHLHFDPGKFPPGTKIVISMPICPNCCETQETCQCGFDWHAWVEEEYA